MQKNQADNWIERITSARQRERLQKPACYCKKYLQKRAKGTRLLSKIIQRIRSIEPIELRDDDVLRNLLRLLSYPNIPYTLQIACK